MNRNWRFLAATAVVLATLAGPVNAAPPALEFAYSKQTSLAPGAYKFVFSLWESPTAASPLWTSGQVAITLRTPVLVYTLGSGKAKIPASLDTSQQLFLSVEKVSPLPKLIVAKRERLAIAPYAAGSGTRVCQAGDMVQCFSGTLEQVGRGICRPGVRLCKADGTGFDATCVNEVPPATETCNGDDDDCDGVTDETCWVCGDGVLEGEECDDGDTVPGDGCDAACLEEAGWNCVGAPSVCTTVCGDGICAGAENVTCPGDCGGGVYCGNGVCEPLIGENLSTCPADCGAP